MSLKDRLKNAQAPLVKPIKREESLECEVIPTWNDDEGAQLECVKEFLALHNQDLSKTVFKFCVDKKYLINAILPPTSLSGVIFRVRRIVRKKLEEIVEDKSDLIKILRAIESKSNILITGDEGKTTLLDSILAKINSKVITMEESPQLQLAGKKITKLLKSVDIKEFALSKFAAETIVIDDCKRDEFEYISQLGTNYIVVMNEKVDGFDVVLEIKDYKISVC